MTEALLNLKEPSRGPNIYGFLQQCLTCETCVSAGFISATSPPLENGEINRNAGSLESTAGRKIHKTCSDCGGVFSSLQIKDVIVCICGVHTNMIGLTVQAGSGDPEHPSAMLLYAQLEDFP